MARLLAASFVGVPLWRRLSAFVAPMIAGNTLQLFSGTAIAAMLGRLAGTHALAAAGVVFPITLFYYAIATGLTNGATILLARAQGAAQTDAGKCVVVEALVLATLLGALFAFIGIVLGTPILHAVRTPASIFTQTLIYLRIVSCSMITVVPYMMYEALLDGLGDSKTPFAMLTASTVLSLALTYALIVGFGPLPKLGLAGAAIGTLIAFAVVTLAAACALPRMHAAFRLPAAGVRALLARGQTAWDILRLGMPIALQYIAISISQLIVMAIIAHAGAAALSVYAATSQIVDYVMTPLSMIGIAVSALSAKALGAGKTQDVPAIGRTAVVVMLLLTGTLTLSVYAFVRPLLALFLTAPAAVELGRRALVAMLWSVPILGIGEVAASISRTERFAFGPMAANIAGVLLILLPCAKMLVAHNGIIGVWQAYPITYIAIALMEVAYFALTWRRLQRSLQPRAV